MHILVCVCHKYEKTKQRTINQVQKVSLDSGHDRLSEGISVLESSWYQDRSFTEVTTSCRTKCVCVCICVCTCVCDYCIHTYTLPFHSTTHTHVGAPTFFVVPADDGVPHAVGAAESDAALLAAGGGRRSRPDSTLLAPEALFPLVVRPYLVTAHPPDQPLALADGERLQQTLVYLHVLTEDITQLETT